MHKSTKPILLSFLGTGKYETVTYTPPANLQGEHVVPVETRFFSKALADWVEPKEVLVFVTTKARTINSAQLLDEIQARNPRLIDIPTSANEQDLWALFECLYSEVPDNACVYLDITHAFRYLPLLGILVAFYLKVTKGVQIGGIYYGAFEATQNPIKPTFDLTPFTELLDWTTAAYTFFNTGDADPFADILKTSHQDLWRQAGLPKDQRPHSLAKLGEQLKQTSANLRTLRLHDLKKSAALLARITPAASAEVATHLKPFATILELVSSDLSRHRDAGLADPTPDILARQLDTMEWLAEKGHLAATLTLAREWVISAFAQTLRPDKALPLQEASARSPLESILNGYQPKPKAKNEVDRLKEEQDILEWQTAKETLPDRQFERFKRVFDSIASRRNSLNHADHTSSRCPSSNLAGNVKEHIAELRQLHQDLLAPTD